MTSTFITNINYRNKWYKQNKKVINKPIISIVLPTLNGFPLIKRAIKSIIDQTFEEWELIIVNDGSTETKLKQFLFNLNKKYNNIKLITLEQNKGLPTALNEGLKISKGEYWTWISDDNEFYPETLQILYKEIKKGYDFVYSDFYFINNINGAINKRSKHYNNKNDLLVSWQGMACYMWRKELMNKIGEFGSDLQGIEDYDYVIRTFIQLKDSNISHIRQYLMNYYRDKNTLSIKLKDKIEKLKKHIIDKYI